MSEEWIKYKREKQNKYKIIEFFIFNREEKIITG
jgi:hypothetical protein